MQSCSTSRATAPRSGWLPDAPAYDPWLSLLLVSPLCHPDSRAPADQRRASLVGMRGHGRRPDSQEAVGWRSLSVLQLRRDRNGEGPASADATKASSKLCVIPALLGRLQPTAPHLKRLMVSAVELHCWPGARQWLPRSMAIPGFVGRASNSAAARGRVVAPRPAPSARRIPVGWLRRLRSKL